MSVMENHIIPDLTRGVEDIGVQSVLKTIWELLAIDNPVRLLSMLWKTRGTFPPYISEGPIPPKGERKDVHGKDRKMPSYVMRWHCLSKEKSFTVFPPVQSVTSSLPTQSCQ